mgnify:CR=1 FL=1|jgi:hypothetical protein
MALPKIDLPIFELELPSSGEKVKYRPFTVKEEKILLVAQESKDATQEVLASKQIVNNCLIDKDVADLPMFDLEYVLLILRSKSVDNNIGFNIKDPDTEEDIKLSLDLDTITLTHYPGHSNEIKVNDDYTLYLKYPTIDQFLQIVQTDSNDPLLNYLMMVTCLDKLASEDEVHKFSDYSNNDIDAFMDGLDGTIIKQIQKFFETMPKLRHEMPYTNSEGKEQVFVVEGMRSFFT